MASIPDNYEMNVSKDGRHFCKIQLPMIEYKDESAEEKLRFFRELFGSDYHVSMTHWVCRGESKNGWQ